jgi:spectinomycin phosphotransferase
VHQRPADLADHELAAVLASHWQLAPADLRYLPVGFGGFHWLAAEATGARWFVTVNERPAGDPGRADLEASMETAASLAFAGLDFVVAPVRTRAGRAVAWLGSRHAVTLFPYSEGVPGSFDDVLTGGELTTLVGMLAALHDATTVIGAGAVPVRGIELAERAVVAASLRERGRPWSGGPYAEPARALLNQYADGLSRALARFDALADRVFSDGRSLVITHGEPHPGNVIRSGTRLFLVDWDTVGLAPPERDLWWVLNGDGQDAVSYAALAGHAVSRDGLALYRLRWTLDDISLFLAEFRGLHEQTADTELSWSGFRDGLVSLDRDKGGEQGGVTTDTCRT